CRPPPRTPTILYIRPVPEIQGSDGREKADAGIITTLAPNCGLLRFAFADEDARKSARHAPRHREGEPARAARRHAGAVAAPERARRGADPSAHHHGFFRIAARADHRGAGARRELPRGADADPPERLSPHRR